MGIQLTHQRSEWHRRAEKLVSVCLRGHHIEKGRVSQDLPNPLFFLSVSFAPMERQATYAHVLSPQPGCSEATPAQLSLFRLQSPFYRPTALKAHELQRHRTGPLPTRPSTTCKSPDVSQSLLFLTVRTWIAHLAFPHVVGVRAISPQARQRRPATQRQDDQTSDHTLSIESEPPNQTKVFNAPTSRDGFWCGEVILYYQKLGLRLPIFHKPRPERGIASPPMESISLHSRKLQDSVSYLRRVNRLRPVQLVHLSVPQWRALLADVAKDYRQP